MTRWPPTTPRASGMPGCAEIWIGSPASPGSWRTGWTWPSSAELGALNLRGWTWRDLPRMQAKAVAVRRQRVLQRYAEHKKWCPRCGRVLGFEALGPSRQTADRLKSWCRECFAAYQRAREAAKRAAAEKAAVWAELAALLARRGPAPGNGT
jgi:hypothetical protein